jgi:hypothetical protein
VAGLLAVAGANWLVDPYSIYGSPRITGFNADKVEFLSYLRLTKPYQVERRRPAALILGTSRSGIGLSAEHRAWRSAAVYNLAIPDAGIYETLRYLQHAQAVRPIERVVLALDFRSFNAKRIDAAFSEGRLAVARDGERNPQRPAARLQDLAATLASWDALANTLRTVRRQGWGRERLLEDGSWERVDEHFRHFAAFLSYTRATVQRYQDAQQRPDGFAPLTPDNPVFADYRAILRTAYASGIDLRVLISPSHAWHWETLRQLGLWPRFETLKRTLVTIHQEEAARAGAHPIPLWDFSGTNSLTAEPVPQTDTGAKPMTWFWESIHYKKTLGDLVLQKVLADEDHPTPVPSEFGVLLTPERLDLHLAQWEASHSLWLEANSSVAHQIARLAKRSPPGAPAQASRANEAPPPPVAPRTRRLESHRRTNLTRPPCIHF